MLSLRDASLNFEVGVRCPRRHVFSSLTLENLSCNWDTALIFLCILVIFSLDFAEEVEDLVSLLMRFFAWDLVMCGLSGAWVGAVFGEAGLGAKTSWESSSGEEVKSKTKISKGSSFWSFLEHSGPWTKQKSVKSMKNDLITAHCRPSFKTRLPGFKWT